MKALYTKLADFPAWTLEAYADGESMPQVAAFVQQHRADWQQWLQQNQPEQRLRRTLYRFDCPSVETIRADAWDELPAPEHEQIVAHVAICPLCANELTSVRAFIADNQPTHPAHSTPASSQPDWWQPIQALVEQMRLVVANLITPMPQLAGVALRSAPAGSRLEQNTTLLFEAENTDISLTLQKERNETFALAGQIFLAEPAEIKATVRLASDHTNTEIIISDIPETGSFIVQAIPPGDYQMVIVFPHQAVVIPHLALH